MEQPILPIKRKRYVYTYPPFKEALQQKDISILYAVAKEIGGIASTSNLSKDDLVEFIFNSIVNENRFDVLFEYIALLDRMSYDSLEMSLRRGGLVVFDSIPGKGELAIFRKSFFVHIRRDELCSDNEYIVDFPQEIRKIIKKNKDQLKAKRDTYDLLDNLIYNASALYGVYSLSDLFDIIRHYDIHPLIRWGRNTILKILRHRNPNNSLYFYQSPYFANADLLYINHNPKKAIQSFLKIAADVPLWYPPTLDGLIKISYESNFYETEVFHNFDQFILERYMKKSRDWDGLACGLYYRFNRGEPIEKIAQSFEAYRTRPEREGDHEALLQQLRMLDENSRLRPRRGHTEQEMQELLKQKN